MRTVTLDELPQLVGTTLGPSSWSVVDQGGIDTFGQVTRDMQWIHVDPIAAKAGPFGTTIAHGYFTLSLIPHLMAELISVDCRQTLNYGTEKVRFPAAVLVGSRIRLSFFPATVDEVTNGFQVGFQASVECEGLVKPACVALVVYRFLR
jgi:acyl dehydratase